MKTQKFKLLTLAFLHRSTFYLFCTLLLVTTSFGSNLGELYELKENLQSIQHELGQVKVDEISNNSVGNIDNDSQVEPEADRVEIIPQKKKTKEQITPIIKPQNAEPIRLIEAPYHPIETNRLPNSAQSPIILSKRFSSNYLIISPSIYVSDEIDYKFTNGTTGEIDTGSGFGLHIELGKRINNWEFGLSLGFERTPLEHLL